MALPIDNIWLIRQNYLSSLRDILLKNVAFLADFIEKFKEPTVITENKVGEYSTQASTYAKTMSLVYSSLFDAAEYEEANVEVNGLPQDVQTLLIAGLNISTQNLSLATANAGTWVSAIYNALINSQSELETINDVLSWLQYGLNVWDSAKQITFPEPPPQYDGVPDAKRTPNKNMIYDWELTYSDYLCTIRGLLFEETYEKAGKKGADLGTTSLLLSFTLGEGSTTATQKVVLEQDPDDENLYYKQLCTKLPSIYDVVNQHVVESGLYFVPRYVENLQFGVIHIPILIERPKAVEIVDDLHFYYNAFLEIRNDGTLFLMGYDAELNILNHATYTVNLPRFADVTDWTDSFGGEVDNETRYETDILLGGTSGLILNTIPVQDGDGEDKLNYRFKKDSGAVSKRVSRDLFYASSDNSPYNVRLKGVCTWGFTKGKLITYDTYEKDPDHHNVPTLNISADKFVSEDISFTGEFTMHMEYLSGIKPGVQPPNNFEQFIYFVGKLVILTGGYVDAQKELILYNIEETDNVDAVWSNLNKAEFTENYVDITYYKNLVIRYRFPEVGQPSFSIVNRGDAKVYLAPGVNMVCEAKANVETPHIPVQLSMIEHNVLVKHKVGDAYDTRVSQRAVDISGVPLPTYSVYGQYFLKVDPEEGDILIESYVISDDTYRICQGTFPNFKIKPKATLTFATFIFNIYCEDNFLIIYELVIRTKGWKQGKAILFSKGAISTDFIPAQHLIMQIGLMSYVVIQNDGSAIIQLSDDDIKSLSVGDRFIVAFPSIPLIRAKAFTPPKKDAVTPVTTIDITPGQKPGVSLLPQFGIDLSKYTEEPDRGNLFYEWVNVPLKRFSRYIYKNSVTMLILDFNSAEKENTIRRHFKPDEDTDWVIDTIVSPEQIALFRDECLFTKSPDDKDYKEQVRLYSSDNIALYLTDIKFVEGSDVKDPTTNKVITQTHRLAFRIAEFPWAFDLIKNIKKDAEALALGIDTLLKSWDQISKYDYFKSVIEHNKQYSTHIALIADLVSRIQNETRGIKGSLPVPTPDDASAVSRIGSSVYEAWNTRWQNL